MKRVALIAVLLTLSLACVKQSKPGPSQATQVPSHTPPANSALTPNASPTPSVELANVIDQANVIDPATENQLQTRLAQLREREDIDFAVVTVNTIGAQSAFDASLKLAREREAAIKSPGSNGKLLLLVAVNDRKWHIQVSRKLEAELTNEVLTKLSPTMTESFQQEHFGEGITKYVEAILAKLEELRSHAA